MILNIKQLYARPKPDKSVVSGEQLLALCRAGVKITVLERTKRNGWWKITIAKADK